MYKIVLIVIAISAMFVSCRTSRGNVQANIRYVPDSATAVKVAEAILFPIYGKKIYDERPFKATLQNGVWIVGGTLNINGKTENIIGRTAYIEIRQSDCKILKVLHTR